jgi:hypothetical protein
MTQKHRTTTAAAQEKGTYLKEENTDPGFSGPLILAPVSCPPQFGTYRSKHISMMLLQTNNLIVLPPVLESVHLIQFCHSQQYRKYHVRVTDETLSYGYSANCAPDGGQSTTISVRCLDQTQSLISRYSAKHSSSWDTSQKRQFRSTCVTFFVLRTERKGWTPSL